MGSPIKDLGFLFVFLPTWKRKKKENEKSDTSNVVMGEEAITGMAALVLLKFIVHDHDNLFVAADAVHSIRICAACALCCASFVDPSIHLSQHSKQDFLGVICIARSCFSFSSAIVEPFTGHYVFALGVAKFLSCAQWVLQVLDTRGRLLVALGYGLWPSTVLISEIVQTFILADFCYYYVKRYPQLALLLPSGVKNVKKGRKLMGLDMFLLDEKFLSLKVVVSVSETNPLIIYLRNVEKLLESERFYNLFQILLNKISGSTLLIASRNVFRRKNASLMFNKGRWSCFRLTLTAKHLFMSWLNFARKKLADDKTAKDYNIEGGSVLHLVLVLSGGVDVLWVVTLSLITV
ncbi:unnamed protein product [Brassica rapa subsp. trilocularis]